jgi:dihydroorotase-like cyclic amidohydrolase
VAIKERLHAFCEEFTDFVLFDEQRHSYIINIDKKYFRTVYSMFKGAEFTLKHVSRFSHSDDITCVFIKD